VRQPVTNYVLLATAHDRERRCAGQVSVVTIQSRSRGSLLGVAIGDALGAPFEGAARVSPEDIEKPLPESRELRFTDDTHMTIGVAQSLIECRGFDGAHMARVFANNYQAEPWRGYGSGPPRIFDAILNGAPWDVPASQLFGGAGSFGNGAAMRVAPVALYARGDLLRVAELARQTARITHAHQLGMEGAAIQACAVALLLESDAGAELCPTEFLAALRGYVPSAPYRAALDKIERLLPNASAETVARVIGNDITALAAVPAALCCFLRHPDSFAEAVRFAISLGGDTDTIASMTGALSGARLGEQAIPPAWRKRVESADLLRDLADHLLRVSIDDEA